MPSSRKIFFLTVSICLLLLMGGCTFDPLLASDPVLVSESLDLMTEYSVGMPLGIQRLDVDKSIDTPKSLAPNADSMSVDSDKTDTLWTASVTIKNAQVNIRSGPGLDYQPIAIIGADTIFKTYGKTADGWWRVCCFQGIDDVPDQPTQPAWVSEDVVDANADAIALPILESIFPESVNAVWDVNYQCGSDTCVERTCTATVTANQQNDLDQFWLIIDRQVVWVDNCGQDSVWRHQLDQFDGRDLYATQTDIFLNDYWRGTNLGKANSFFMYPDGRKVMAWCDAQLFGEVEQSDGWSNTYSGTACYDVRTGTLLSMRYVKRWLFSGEFAGEQYNRAYSGDFEMYEVTLNKTNIELAFQ
jgi:hypothetical protein